MSSKFNSALSKLAIFYENEFSLDPALKVIGLQDFDKREFGFQVVKDNAIRFVRNISFETPEKLKKYILDHTPLAIYVGAIYNEGPNYFEQKSIQNLEWIRREFIFDIDLTEYDSVRPCSCVGKNQACEFCWELINVSIKWIQETLEEDFGVKDIKWVFSGRRGVHAWILDRSMSFIDDEQRAAIVNYLTFFKGDGDSAKISPSAKFNTRYQERVKKIIFDSFFNHTTINQLEKLGFSKQRANVILTQRDDMGITNSFYSNHVYSTERASTIVPSQRLPTREEINQNILLRWSPRLDTAVTIDLRRILRMPGSIHGESGKRVRFLNYDELEFFNPTDEESIYNQ
jgi:DNA primase small subunit